MPEFFAFTLGAETNPRFLRNPEETSPLLVGRFRAVVTPPPGGPLSQHSHSHSHQNQIQQQRRWQPSRLGDNPHQPHVHHLQRHERWRIWADGERPAQSSFLPANPGYGTMNPGYYDGMGDADDEEDEGEEECEGEEEDAQEESAPEGEPQTGEESHSLLDTASRASKGRNHVIYSLRWPWLRRQRRASLAIGVAGPQGRYRRRNRHHRRRRGPLFGIRRAMRRSAMRTVHLLRDLWLTPQPMAVRRAVHRWWSRWALLVVLPAVLAVAWCAVPIPVRPLLGEDDDEAGRSHQHSHRRPAHGEARVRLNFWFFLFVYYGPYNLVALLWITKVFNLYSLNWWSPSLGFPASASLLAAISLAIPALFYLAAPTEFAARLATHNTAWTTWTFAVMAMPVAAALAMLLLHERHLALRRSLSATQRIFTTATWAGEFDRPGSAGRGRGRGRGGSGHGSGRRDDGRWSRPGTALSEHHASSDEPSSSLPGLSGSRRLYTLQHQPPHSEAATRQQLRRAWLPSSFVRFLWLTCALLVSLLVYVLGEVSASLFLAALPAMQHETVYAVIYVWAWTVIVYLLDLLTAWILGGFQGERVGSYPLGWVFKLYFMLTYQTYVRALYARLRSPSQVVYLQVLSSSIVVVFTPLLMSPWTHRLLVALGLNTLAYAAFQKVCARNVFVRFVAENATMIAFLGALFVLHFGPNRNVYPYFAFDNEDSSPSLSSFASFLSSSLHTSPDSYRQPYTFSFTLYAACITWGCELVAAVVVCALLRGFYGVAVVAEAKADLVAWPELLPTSVAVSVHVLQNMVFSIIRLRF